MSVPLARSALVRVVLVALLVSAPTLPRAEAAPSRTPGPQGTGGRALAPAHAAAEGVRVTLWDDMPAEQAGSAPGENTPVLAVHGIRSGDIVVREFKTWEPKAAPKAVSSLDALRAVGAGGSAQGRDPMRAPVLVLRDGKPVWLPYERATFPYVGIAEAVPLTPEQEQTIREALADPDAGMSDSARRKRAGEATEAIEFSGLAPESTEALPGCSSDPFGGVYYSDNQDHDVNLGSGVTERTRLETRFLAYPGEDLERAWKGAKEWLDHYAEALAALGWETVSRTESSSPNTSGWRIAFTKQPSPEDALPAGAAPARETLDVGYVPALSCFYRRYSGLVLDTEQGRAALGRVREALAVPGGKATKRRAILHQAKAAYGEETVAALLGALEPRGPVEDATDLARAIAPYRTFRTDSRWLDPMLYSPEAPDLDAALHRIVTGLCKRLGVAASHVSVGVCNLDTNDYALFDGDHMRYGGCLPKIAILLTVFQDEAEGRRKITDGDLLTMARMLRLSLMPEAGEMGRKVGLTRIHQVLQYPQYRLYDKSLGGGIWTGRYYEGHYGPTYRDPVAGYSHGLTVRQVLRYYWMLHYGLLVSPKASERMRAVFTDGRVPILDDRFVKGLDGRGYTLVRKSGWYDTYTNDSALVTGQGLRYIIAGHVDSADEGHNFLEAFAREIDDYLSGRKAEPK